MIESRKSEIRYVTDDPKRMLGKWITKSVFRHWTEDFADEDTKEVVSVDRTEMLFERGTYIDQDVLSQIRFFISEGSIKEIEVSNQNRKGLELENTALHPYLAKIEIDGKAKKFLLHASSIRNVLDIMSDYTELEFKGGFQIVMAQEFQDCIILVDKFKKIDLETEYLKDNIDTDEYLNNKIEENPDKKHENELPDKFYQISSIISIDGAPQENPQCFIVHTNSVDRAMSVINSYLLKNEKERIERLKKNKNVTVDDTEERELVASIEEVKVIPIARYVPLEFSLVYNDD